MESGVSECWSAGKTLCGLPVASGNSHGKGRSLAELALHLRAAAGQLREVLDDVKAEPDTAVRPCFGTVHLTEHLENNGPIFRGNADAGVCDRKLDAGVHCGFVVFCF